VTVLRMAKYHGAGNDFLVVIDLDDRRPLRAAEVRALCDRHRGVGADGVIRALASADTDVAMELHNADGSPAEMSGNGVRCLAHAVVDAGLVTPRRPAGPAVAEATVTVATPAGRREVEVCIAADGQVTGAVAMGTVTLGAAHTVGTAGAVPGPERAGGAVVSAEVDVAGGADAAGGAGGAGGADVAGGAGGWGVPEGPPAGTRMRWARVGNPHLVVAVPPGAGPLEGWLAWAAAVDQVTPGGVNVELVRVVGPSSVDLVVWERGVGATQACGTGTCAAAVALQAWGDVTMPVDVANPGGTLTVRWVADHLELRGPSERVATVEVTEDDLRAAVRAVEVAGPVPGPDAVAPVGAAGGAVTMRHARS
jgi:diaminopimelate epimerase